MTVYLVGAGPGDPGLLTLRAKELLERADVVIHDRLVDQRVLALARAGAVHIDVGKQLGEDRASQELINKLLCEQAGLYQVVVRLKGGDPYVFGRGGEEALALKGAGIDYEVIPGVSSLSAVPAYAGVPLTMRGVSSQVTVITGHDPAAVTNARNWAALATPGSTLVILMGVAQRGEIARQLLAAGRLANTPVLVVEKGTTPKQRSRRMALSELGNANVRAPATIVVGEVAAIDLSSYEQLPLFGWRVVVTRSASQSHDLEALLHANGAEVLSLPTIEIAPARDGEAALARVLDRLGDFDWVVFSSQNAVDAVFGHIGDARAFSHAQVAAVGSQTAAALEKRGIVADLIAASFGTDALLSAFPPPKPRGSVLIPRSSLGGSQLPDALHELGWDVEVVEAYQTLARTPTDTELDQVREADAVTFTSASTVSGFVTGAGRVLLPEVVISIGPATSTRLAEEQIEVSAEASVHTAAGVVQALVDFALQQQSSRTDAPRLGPRLER